jgi:tetratricopeptide (TPR) repeat protein
LYKKGLETGILLENNLLSRYTFGNAVGAALKIQQFEWAEKFIRDFEPHLEEKQRKSIVNFNLSRVYFEKGDYDKAQRLLFDFEYDDMLLNIIAKTMLLKIYYEQGEFDALESLLESMRIYLQRKEALDPARKTAYKNLISLMKKLLNHNPYSKTQTERLRSLVENTHPLMERDWLLRQLEGNKR